MLKCKYQLLNGDPVYGVKLADVSLNNVDYTQHTIDITNKDSKGCKEIIGGGARILISVTGVFKDQASHDTISSCVGRRDKNIFSIVGDSMPYTKLFIRTLEDNAQDNTFNATLCSDILG